MDTLIDLARGPLFRISLAICLLGLAYRLGSALWQLNGAYRRAADKELDRRTILRATFGWLLPVRLLRMRPVYSVASAVFHLGILLVPLFYVGHVRLWQQSVALPWPVLGSGISDVLTLAALVGLGVILASRLVIAASRQLSRAEDILLLIMLMVLLASGYWVAHPLSAPFDPRGLLLLHVLAGNLALILTPLTKIVHCILMPLTQAISEVGWRFPAESGRHVGIALSKENEPV
jgi:nitrate reductase gamma subunit